MAGEKEEHVQDVQEFISSLPSDDAWVPMRLYNGFWIFEDWLPGTKAAQQRLVARDDDVLVATLPKTGTTWLKSLVFSVVHRGRHPPGDPSHPLRLANPHECVEQLEEKFTIENRAAQLLEALPSPRVLATHLPYSLLPASLVLSECKIVYLCRDPKDVVVSFWHFKKKLGVRNNKEMTMERGVDLFCSGMYPSGPYCENVLEFWNEFCKRPNKVLFLKYEDLKEDPAGNLRRLAAFVGKPFSEEEERDGTVRQILELCSFRSLKEMEVNRSAEKVTTLKTLTVPKNSLFRQGEVGDWVNHFTPEMAEKIDTLMREKFQGSGLKL